MFRADSGLWDQWRSRLHANKYIQNRHVLNSYRLAWFLAVLLRHDQSCLLSKKITINFSKRPSHELKFNNCRCRSSSKRGAFVGVLSGQVCTPCTFVQPVLPSADEFQPDSLESKFILFYFIFKNSLVLRKQIFEGFNLQHGIVYEKKISPERLLFELSKWQEELHALLEDAEI
jgi:hypothetical protein